MKKYTALGNKPTVEEVAAVLRSMASSKAVGPGEFPRELLKLGLHHDQAVLQEFHRVIIRVWPEKTIPEIWRNAMIKVPYKKKDRTDCGNYRCVSFMAHTGNILQIIATRFGDYCDARPRDC